MLDTGGVDDDGRVAAVRLGVLREEVHERVGSLTPMPPTLPARDAALWVQQTLVEIGFAVLGVLAGLNRRYYSAFQFKHMHAFVDSLEHKPPDLAERLAKLVDGDQAAAIAHVEALVHDTLDLLSRYLPDVDLPAFGHQPGERLQPWR